MKYPWLYEYLSGFKGVTHDFKVEWQWLRYMIGGKMFAAVCKNDAGEDSIVTLKLKPEEGEVLRSTYKDITPGYYMNKQHWNSVDLNGSVPDDLLREMCDKAYSIVKDSLPKKLKAEIDSI